MTSLPSLVGQALGAVELGVLCSSILYGVMLVQTYNYYQLRFKDGPFIKSIVRLQRDAFALLSRL